MKKVAWVSLAVIMSCMSTITFAQKSVQELEMEQSRLRWQADLARQQAENARLEMWLESRKAEEDAEQAASERAEALRIAEASKEAAKEAAENLRDEIEQAAIRTKNNIYFGVLFLFTAGFVTYIIRESKKEKIMQESQKFGIAAIIGSALVIVFAIMISDGWQYRLDFLQNLMSWLRIKLFENENNDYLIDVPTKYIVLACICTAAYGLTTYLGITPVPKRKIQNTDGAGTDITP